jgi:glycosyltransferase involved in cell wall biosynthesis
MKISWRRAIRKSAANILAEPGANLDSGSQLLPQKHYRSRKKDVSIIVVLYNIFREVPRTLLSLSSDYQRHIDAEEYEVIVVDNGSQPAVDRTLFDGLAGDFHLIRIDPAPSSPAYAINHGLAEASGDVIGVMIDGARMVTPGLVHFARHGVRLYRTAVVTPLGWYLGSDYQRFAIQGGYDKPREDALLESISWPDDGYRLFEIGTIDESSIDGWLKPLAEASALFLSRDNWSALGGWDEQFDAPGGGYLNLDTYRRALELPDARPVILLGEGTFHQLHGGVATNATPDRLRENLILWSDQYQRIRGQPYETVRPSQPTTYIGTLTSSALAHFTRAALEPVRQGEPLLGTGFDRALWAPRPPSRPADPAIAELVDLAHEEFRAARYTAAAAVARLTRERAPDEPEPQRLLRLVAGWVTQDGPQEPWRAEYYLALGKAYHRLGEKIAAEEHYRKALCVDRNLKEARGLISMLRMPGESYRIWLERLYAALSPKALVEIGIGEGRSLACVRPPTLAIGIDPKPVLVMPLSAETHVFAETSDKFFAAGKLDPLLAGRPVDVGFINGPHLYEQALRDFMNLERYCGPRSVILIHDTIPLDEETQSRAPNGQLHTGDVWKIILCLKHYRADLELFTIATPWSGLTVVTGFGTNGARFRDIYEEVVARFIDLPFSNIEGCMEDALNIVPNDWDLIVARLQARSIL